MVLLDGEGGGKPSLWAHQVAGGVLYMATTYSTAGGRRVAMTFVPDMIVDNATDHEASWKIQGGS